MAIQGFDYNAFAQNLTAQAQELVPQDFNDMQKQYVANTLLNFSTLAGEALYNDTESNFNADQAVMITQIIAEWSFHKSVDLIRSGLPQQFWDPIMQKVAFTIFEIAKQTFKQNMPQDQILQLIEHHVKKTYAEAVQELKDKNLIDENLANMAAHQSNIDQMMQQMQEEAPQDAGGAPMPSQNDMSAQGDMSQSSVAASPKLLKLVSVALLFRNMKQDKVQTILNKFDPQDAQTIIKYMQMTDLESKVDTASAMRALQEFRSKMPRVPDLTPSKIVKNIKKLSETVERDQLEQLLKLERQKVKRFIFNAIEGEYYEMPPKVANIIATHVQSSV